MTIFSASLLPNSFFSATTSNLSFPPRNPSLTFSGSLHFSGHFSVNHHLHRSMTTTTVAASSSSSSSSSSSEHIPPIIPVLEESLLKHDVICIRAISSLLAKQGLLTISEKEFVVEALKDEKTVDMSSVIDLLRSASNRKLEEDPAELLLWTEEAIDAIIAYITRFQVALLTLAVKNAGVIVIVTDPHLKREQPILLEHHLLNYVEQLDRDAKRQEDCKKRLNLDVASDAAAAMYLNAPMMNRFRELSEETTSLELLSAISIMANHLSHIRVQWVAWTSDTFGFITSSDSVLTNQLDEVLDDILTLQRSFSNAYKSYGKEQRKLAFGGVKKVIETLEVLSNFARKIKYHKDKLSMKDLQAGYDAAAVADYLVLKGVPFATSNEIVGKAVALCLNKRCQLQNLSLEEFQSINMMIDTDVYEFLGVENSVKQFTSYGSTGSQAIAAQLDFWIKKLNK